ncbi:MAG TPA: hypothetical protein VL171_07400 [Verrucomicrobiae bacterium]|nr:hypothetical protein [Verrucomicrobiae bacterium]
MSRPRSTTLLMAMVAATIGCIVFWPCLHNGFLQWDDLTFYIGPVAQHGGLSPQSIRWAFAQSATTAGYYQPLTWLSLLVDYSLWGPRPLAFHATNLSLHALNIMLVIVYVERLLRSASFFSEYERYIVALLTGLVFAIHPLQVESVAWVAERKTLLCAVFVLASLYAHVRLAEQPSARIWFSVMNGCFLLALLSKPMAIPLPAILLVLDWYPLRRLATTGWRRLLTEKSPMFVLSVLGAAATFLTQSHQGAINSSIGLIDRLLMIPRNLVFYAWKLIWPAWQSPFYPTAQHVSVWSAEYLLPLVLALVVCVTAMWSRRRFPAFLSALSVYVLFLAPVSGLIPLGGYAVADRYAYLAILPLLVLAGSTAVCFWRSLWPTSRITMAVLIVGGILFYAQTSRVQIGVWRNDETLWAAVLSHYPNSPVANCQLAAALVDRRQFEQASVFARRAVEWSPDFPDGLATLGLIDLKLRHFAEAQKELNAAIEAKPTLLTAHYNLACADVRLGRLAEAYDLLRRLIAAHPEYAALAARDGELAALRNDPRYAAQFTELISTSRKQ